MIGLFVAAASTAVLASPNGARLHAVDQCFAIERKGQPIGLTRQVVRASRLNGRPVWDIVVHQKADAMHFDLRDHFVLARKDLQPITFDSRKDGVEDVKLSYANGHVTGHKAGDKGQQEPVDIAFTGPIWEGNLWGITFGALPLRMGTEFSLPFYQYDQGLGRFTLKATGTESVQTPAGPVQAWVVDAGTYKSPRVTYLIDKKTGDELGTRAEGFGTRLGGDCSGID
jgi:FAD/FMN-containing dehydrogenase